MTAHTHLVHSVKTHAELFEKRARKAAKQASVSRVHGLRVVSRRLRALFSLVPREDRKRALRKTIRDLKKLTRLLGEQRKFDIALKDAISFSRETEEIERGRQKARREVERALTGTRRRDYAKTLRAAVKQMRKYDWEVFVPRLQEIHRELEKAKRKTPRGNSAGHSLRIRAKKARYILEALGTPMARLDALQDHLGRWHDLIVLDGLTGHTASMLEEKEKEWETSVRLMKPALSGATHALESVLHASR